MHPPLKRHGVMRLTKVERMTNEENDLEQLTQNRSGSQKRRRQSQVNVGFLPEERALLEGRAAAAGLSVASYVRVCALGKAGPRARRAPTVEAAVLRDCVAELQKLGERLERIERKPKLLHDEARQEVERLFVSLSQALETLNELVGREP